MGVIRLLFLFLALIKYTCGEEAYHNRAMWFVGNTTAPPPTDTQPDKPDKVGNTTIINRCNYPIYVCSMLHGKLLRWLSLDNIAPWDFPASIVLNGLREAWEAHQTFKKSLPGRSKETYKIIDSYRLPDNSTCTDNCGVTYKLFKSDRLVAGVGGNQVQFEYSTRKGLFYYDFSFVDCAKDIAYRQGNAGKCPAWDAGLRIQVTSGCKEMTCGQAEMCIHDGQGGYYIDQPVQKWGLGEPIGTCPNYKQGTEIGIVLCSSAPPLVKESD